MNRLELALLALVTFIGGMLASKGSATHDAALAVAGLALVAVAAVAIMMGGRE